MRREIRTLALIIVGASILGMFTLGVGTSHAQSGGGVGSGGNGGGSDSSGHWTWFGWGWRLYSTSGSGPASGFKSGTWSAAKSACTGHSSQIAVFVILNSGGSAMGYNYRSVYYGPPTYMGYKSTSPYIPVSTARSVYNSLPSALKTGYTFGTNVGWFCYGYTTTNPPATLDGYKIDDSGGGAPYYGARPAALTGITVSVTSAGSDSRNPFYFTNATGGGSALSVGTGTTTARVVRVTNVPPDWQVVGYGICYGSGCNPFASGVRPSAGATPTLTFTSGRAYHMRWVFRQIPDPTCSSESFPDTMAVGRPYTFSVRVGVGAWPLSPVPTMYVKLTDPLGNTVIDNVNQPYTVSGLRLTSNPITYTPTMAGTYSLTWGLSGFWAVSCPAGGGSTPGDAGEQPYLAINGGDALAGDEGITGYNLGSGSYNGGGAQLAALSSGDIVGFVTGKGNSAGVATQNGASMGFANVPAPGAGIYGGNLNVLPAASTIPAGLAATGPPMSGSVDVGLLASGVYELDAGTRIHGTLSAGKDVTVFAPSGDIIIDGGIGYSYGSLADAPRLNVYTQDGDIIIDRAVTQIHAVLIAESNDDTKGFVYTCGVGGVGLGYAALNGNGTACSPKLTIFGSVTANQIILGRTSGSWVPGRPDTSAAETILYSPEVWMHRSDPTTSNTGDTKGPFDSYFTLPPIL